MAIVDANLSHRERAGLGRFSTGVHGLTPPPQAPNRANGAAGCQASPFTPRGAPLVLVALVLPGTWGRCQGSTWAAADAPIGHAGCGYAATASGGAPGEQNLDLGSAWRARAFGEPQAVPCLAYNSVEPGAWLRRVASCCGRCRAASRGRNTEHGARYAPSAWRAQPGVR